MGAARVRGCAVSYDIPSELPEFVQSVLRLRPGLEIVAQKAGNQVCRVWLVYYRLNNAQRIPLDPGRVRYDATAEQWQAALSNFVDQANIWAVFAATFPGTLP